MSVINLSQSRTFLLRRCRFLPGPVPWLPLMMIPLVYMSDIAHQMIVSIFSLSLAFSLVPIWYNGQSTSSLRKQSSQLAFIDCCHPQPLPSPIKNGETFSSAAWSLNPRILHVQRLKNMPIVCLGRPLMTYAWTPQIQQLPLLPLLTLKLKQSCGVSRSSISGSSSLLYTGMRGRWTLMLSNVMRLSVMFCSSPHYR